jgi:hypothetical protein
MPLRVRAHVFSISALVLFSIFAALISRSFATAAPKEEMTPLLLSVQDAPTPFTGSDMSTHLAYEILLTNFSSGDVTLEKVEILGDGSELQTLDSKEIATRLQPIGTREPVGTLAKSTQALLFIHFQMPEGQHPPRELTHRVTARFAAAPPGHQEITATGGNIAVDHRPVAVIGPPLHGDGYISADSCCDAIRHTRATLPINGRFWVAQRYAVDWEQVNEQGRIYRGPREKLESYNIFGKEAIAVADATVASTTDGTPIPHILLTPPLHPKKALPLDQLVINFR